MMTRLGHTGGSTRASLGHRPFYGRGMTLTGSAHFATGWSSTFVSMLRSTTLGISMPLAV